MIEREKVVDAIQQVYDPEIPVNVYDLGLIYNIDIQDTVIKVKMTLTTQGCPSAQQIPAMIKGRLMTIPGVTDVTVDVIWEPQWNPSMISAEGKKILHLDEDPA